jgi:hypothetical protein
MGSQLRCAQSARIGAVQFGTVGTNNTSLFRKLVGRIDQVNALNLTGLNALTRDIAGAGEIGETGLLVPRSRTEHPPDKTILAAQSIQTQGQSLSRLSP